MTDPRKNEREALLRLASEITTRPDDSRFPSPVSRGGEGGGK